MINAFLNKRTLVSVAVVGVASTMVVACSGDSGVYQPQAIGTGGSSSGVDSSVAVDLGVLCEAGGCDAAVGPGGSVGDECAVEEPCRVGTVCEGSVCAFTGDTAEGEACVVSSECAPALQCLVGLSGVGSCGPEGSSAAGGVCSSDADCARGLRCGIQGFGTVCVPEGELDVLLPCSLASECMTGLACLLNSCVTPPPGVPTIGLPVLPANNCGSVSPNNAASHFEVPGAPGSVSGDFFRLPFPNDVRLTGTGINLAGFPTPGDALLGTDPLLPYVQAVEGETGWGAYPSITFRFSAAIDSDSIGAADPIKVVEWVDVTPGESGAKAGYTWSSFGASNNYLCAPWVSIRRPVGRPLQPGHTYAIWLTTSLLNASKLPVTRSIQFEAMMSARAPADPVMAAAYDKYKPMRDYLAAESIDPDTILVASVVTVADIQDPMIALAEAVNSASVPTASNWVKCGDSDAGTAVSPCAQADGDRACGQANADYEEYHALVSLQNFQQGTAPYLSAGGNVDAAASIATDVCMALSVPKSATMPASGWPVVVYAHGTGGSFRSHLRPEVAGVLSTGTTPFAVLGIDQVAHGPRRGGSTASPDTLFFNFANADAARGNPLQGAADQIALGRFAAGLDLANVGGDAILMDADRVLFFGHSQGATHGSLALPFSAEYSAAVLSGNGASIGHALLEKTQPVDIAGVLPIILGDMDSQGRLPGGDDHPALTLISQWIDPADPLNFADNIIRPLEGGTAKHLFQVYGQGDSYSPPLTMQMFASAARLDVESSQVATADNTRGDDLTAPVAGNRSVAITGVVREYEPATGAEGHFVAFDSPTANVDIVRFLSMAANGEIPEVGASND
ncbi:MAG: hypothetical protein HRU17_23260 [Polyangiaceae bacterium]|nr:hypothetical protein [Polyangiaceae bacterium]